MFYNRKKYVSSGLIIALALSLHGCQDDNIGGVSLISPEANLRNSWSDIARPNKTSSNPDARYLNLNEISFREKLDSVALKKSTGEVSPDIISIPLPDNSEVKVSVGLDNLVAPEYRNELPDAKVWSIKSDDSRVMGGDY